MSNVTLRADLDIISQWIAPGSTLIDLGCGSGDLLAHLSKERNVNGYGLEIDKDNIAECFAKGVNVIDQDISHGLDSIPDRHFDVVVMTQALQSMQAPDKTLDEMLRVGKEAIVTFPNFGHWTVRTYLMLKGRMPVSKALPYQWYDTPNIHLCTVRDFETHCAKNGIDIRERALVNSHHHNTLLSRLLPNLFTEIAIYRVSR